MNYIANSTVNHQDYYSPDFELIVDRYVEDIIYSLPEPEYRESLEKAGDYNNLKTTLGIFVSGVLVNYAILNNLSPASVNWGLLNINIKEVISTIDTIIGCIESVDSVDEFLAMISGDEDGSIVLELFGELLDTL